MGLPLMAQPGDKGPRGRGSPPVRVPAVLSRRVFPPGLAFPGPSSPGARSSALVAGEEPLCTGYRTVYRLQRRVQAAYRLQGRVEAVYRLQGSAQPRRGAVAPREVCPWPGGGGVRAGGVPGQEPFPGKQVRAARAAQGAGSRQHD